MKRKPIVGETLYRLNIGNAARRSEQKLVPVVVTKVGRKYFTCAPVGQEWNQVDFYLDSGRQKTNYSADYCIYETKQEWHDEVEKDNLIGLIRSKFQSWGQIDITLQQLRDIKTILDSGKSY